MADGEYRPLSCVGCGVPVPLTLNKDGTPRKNQGAACSITCSTRKYSGKSTAGRTCRQCGGSISHLSVRNKYCSEQCKHRFRYPHLLERAPRPCAQCGVQFVPPLQPDAIFCSKPCAKLAWNVKRNPAHGATVAARRARRVAELLAKQEAETSAALQRTEREAAVVASRHKECRICQAQFCQLPGVGFMAHCSGECSAEAFRRAKRARKSKDKARLRAVTVELVDKFKVFERDRWHCYLCGVHTPPALVGTFDDDAPELEHVVPLSRGGAHAYSNVRCACRSCNAEKSDLLLEDYLAMRA